MSFQSLVSCCTLDDEGPKPTPFVSFVLRRNEEDTIDWLPSTGQNGDSPNSDASETTLLLAPQRNVTGSSKTRVAWNECRILLDYSLRICFSQCLQQSLLLVNVISVGNLGTVELAGSSLANITSNAVGISVIYSELRSPL